MNQEKNDEKNDQAPNNEPPPATPDIIEEAAEPPKAKPDVMTKMQTQEDLEKLTIEQEKGEGEKK